ncbi:hypothetical protein TNCV_3850331 [Trichonephila clavipes]|nr:hypothetical protein TNCV_3850331 [Trichonephila clavipes]
MSIGDRLRNFEQRLSDENHIREHSLLQTTTPGKKVDIEPRHISLTSAPPLIKCSEVLGQEIRTRRCPLTYRDHYVKALLMRNKRIACNISLHSCEDVNPDIYIAMDGTEWIPHNSNVPGKFATRNACDKAMVQQA